MSAELPDFAALKVRFESDAFSNGTRAELRRLAEPNEVAFCPALYRLFPGEKPAECHLRLAFLLPSCSHDPRAKSLGVQLAAAHVAEARVLQVARARVPLDLIQLRRLLTYIKPAVDWNQFGRMVWFWNERSKQQLIEDYYLAKFTPSKGAK